jgi:DNA-binding NtrC family response regulator
MANRVLISLSDDDLAKQLGSLLARGEIQVCMASTGLECLARLRDWHPDLLVVSPNLSWGTGVSVLVLLHEEEDLIPIPTIVLADDTEHLEDHVQPDWIQRKFISPVTPHSVCMAVFNMLSVNQTRNNAMLGDSQCSAPSMQQHLAKHSSKGDLRCAVTQSLTPGYSSSAQLCATPNRVCRFSMASPGLR